MGRFKDDVKFFKDAFLDVFAFFVISFSVTLVVARRFWWLWLVAPMLSVRIWLKAGWESKTSAALTAFKTMKIMSSIAALLLVNYGQISRVSDYAISLCLGINMFEAVLTDLSIQGKYAVPNAISGLLLILRLFGHEAGQQIAHGDLFRFSLSESWVIGYSLWNAAFVYGVGLSLSFGLILFVSYISAFWIMGMPDLWLSLRTYSLAINQGLRGSQLIWIFVPDGKSVITDMEGDNITRNQQFRLFWGAINLAIISFPLVYAR